ncbi:pyruvoyl-dependent arginine decarboxylase [Candidatus Altiarchaeota archaeon]
MIPRQFFVTTGSGVSKISHLNSFDKALFEAGIDNCNLVRVSSILPPGVVQIPPRKIESGSIVFCVLGCMNGGAGEKISSGIGWAKCRSLSGDEDFGLIAEDAGFKDESSLRSDIKEKLVEMAESRNMEILEDNYLTKELSEIPRESFGSVVAALVFLP